MQDLEALGKALFQGNKGQQLEALAQSPEGRRLEQTLDPAAVEKAARSGDARQIKALLEQVLATEEGKSLAKKLSDMGF
jgi:hypothetical protein